MERDELVPPFSSAELDIDLRILSAVEHVRAPLGDFSQTGHFSPAGFICKRLPAHQLVLHQLGQGVEPSTVIYTPGRVDRVLGRAEGKWTLIASIEQHLQQPAADNRIFHEELLSAG